MQANNFYIYEHIRPDTGIVFYVGKGSKWRSGITQHRNQYWQNVVKKAGGFKVRKIVEKVDEELSFLAEQERIDQLKRLGVKLTNLTDGGEGGTGVKVSQETRNKMIASRTGKPTGPRSEESKQRMSAAQKAAGSKHTAESKERSEEHTSELQSRLPSRMPSSA